MLERVGVLVAAAGAGWEVEALRTLAAPASGAVVLKRCVDLPDLLASAATGQARVALVGAPLPGLDADSVSTLRAAGVGVLLLAGEPDGPAGGGLPGVHAVLGSAELDRLATLVAEAAAAVDDGDRDVTGVRQGEPVPVPQDPVGTGRVVAVWGPTGAPGRTTVAVNLAAELAVRGHDTLLVDADAYGGAVAQHLGVLDEVSGLLSAVRLANAGQLDVARLASVARTVAPRLRVLSGLPRADRWSEVRPVAFDVLLETAAAAAPYVVLDLGFSLEQDPGFGSPAPPRNHMTLGGLERADEVVVVGAADPVGLARLARGLVELSEVVPVATVRVAVNRARPSLGWTEHEVRAMVEGFVRPASLHFLPEDRVAVDRAMMAGRALAESGDSAIGRALAESGDSAIGRALAGLADAVEGRPEVARGMLRIRRRRAGRGR